MSTSLCKSLGITHRAHPTAHDLRHPHNPVSTLFPPGRRYGSRAWKRARCCRTFISLPQYHYTKQEEEEEEVWQQFFLKKDSTESVYQLSTNVQNTYTQCTYTCATTHTPSTCKHKINKTR